MGSLREYLESETDCIVRPVKVEKWGRTVYVKSWGVGDRITWATAVRDAEGDLLKRTLLLGLAAAMSLCDEKGKREFSNADADFLNARDPDVMGELFNAIRDVNGLGQESDAPKS